MKQQEIAEALVRYKRVFVKASHSIGKSHLGGGLVNWFYDCFRPSIAITTAPTHQQVTDVLWKEVRIQRRGRPGLQPKAPRMEDAPDHYAVGYTANSGDAFQGRHEAGVFILFDEATGIHSDFWNAAEGMMTGGDHDNYWLCFLNPTDTTTRAYEEELKGNFHTITVSALDHPNIAAELRGEQAPFPKAVRLSWIEARLQEWCDKLPQGDEKGSDIEFPPGSGTWYRPGPLFEGRVLGRWPSASTYAVWSEAVWLAALTPQPLPEEPTEIGCDVARFGDDFTSIHVRRGNCALHHETHNGWSTSQTAGKLKELARQFKQPFEDPEGILTKIDDDGVGGGVTDQKGEFRFDPISGAHRAYLPNDYPNRRSEMWFAVSERANDGRLDLSRLPHDTLMQIRRQAMAPIWKLDSEGRRVVERKEDTKKRIGRSPDDMDALNLAFAPGRRIIGGA